MQFRVGDVVRIFDRDVTPSKHKRHICLCLERRLFLRINSRPIWPPHLKLLASACPDFLEHDSYVEFRQLYRASVRDCREAALLADNPLGRLSAGVARRVAEGARRAETLSEDHQDVVWEALGRLV